ncbi:hypothetical protein J6590_053237 [Homalodisca vitripennis]|nr:hypothetical protein J6590_053237 [Homalodisca vitripennis]
MNPDVSTTRQHRSRARKVKSTNIRHISTGRGCIAMLQSDGHTRSINDVTDNSAGEGRGRVCESRTRELAPYHTTITLPPLDTRVLRYC